MRDEFKLKIHHAVEDGDADAVIALIEHEYEFHCQSWVMAGPGHQSRHECEDRRPHPIEGEHSDFLYEWEGTSEYQELAGGGRRLINAAHRGDGRCGH